MKNKAYTILMALQLTSIGIKYGGSDNNPFKHSTPTVLLFLTAACSHVLASRSQINSPTIFIFNVSGVIGCEALMWILIVPEILWWYIINVPLLLLSFYFNYNQINQLIPDTTPLLVILWLNYDQIKELIRGRTHDPNRVSRARLCVYVYELVADRYVYELVADKSTFRGWNFLPSLPTPTLRLQVSLSLALTLQRPGVSFSLSAAPSQTNTTSNRPSLRRQKCRRRPPPKTSKPPRCSDIRCEHHRRALSFVGRLLGGLVHRTSHGAASVSGHRQGGRRSPRQWLLSFFAGEQGSPFSLLFYFYLLILTGVVTAKEKEAAAIESTGLRFRLTQLADWGNMAYGLPGGMVKIAGIWLGDSVKDAGICLSGRGLIEEMSRDVGRAWWGHFGFGHEGNYEQGITSRMKMKVLTADPCFETIL
ncbi:hypothetical protein V8G54_008439 [Vigna mungo]|uniref:Uncharacterized protein n=1 Tax=Vigna mungo TaxID=3915 RepID=A0AAQ3P5M1_VIGMU